MARPTLPKKIAFGLMVAAGVWLMAEAVVTRLYRAELRAWASPPPTAREGTSVLHGNPYLIYEYPPGDHFERGVTVHINALGLRGPEVAIPKPPGVRRFLTTGDSSVFGFGVEDDQVFSTVAAGILDHDVEAVCGAIPGYSTFQTINLLRLRALATDPDLLVIANIWSDNNFDSFVDKEVLATYRGYRESWTGRLQRLLSRSAIFRVADWKLRVRKRARAIQKVGWMMDSGEHIGLRRVEINDYARNLQTLVDMAHARDAEAMFILLPNREDLEARGSDDPNPKAWDPYREVMRDTARRNGAPLLDFARLFVESDHAPGELFLDEMHPTALGHRLMGEALARFLAEADWPAGGRVEGPGEGGPIPHYEDPFVKGAAPGEAGSPEGGAAPAAGGGARVEGVVTCSSYERGWIQVDLVEPGAGGPQVINSVQIRGPGPFQIGAGAARRVALRAYLDADEDGPDADDRLIDLTDQVLDVGEGSLSGVLVDLDAGRVEVGAAPETPPADP